jgi:hypothetical protein
MSCCERVSDLAPSQPLVNLQVKLICPDCSSVSDLRLWGHGEAVALPGLRCTLCLIFAPSQPWWLRKS